MFSFGYDFFDKDRGGIYEPNGIIGCENANGNVFKSFLPPWWGDYFEKYDIDFMCCGVNDILGYDWIQDRWLYPLDLTDEPLRWFGKLQSKNYIESLFSGISDITLNEIKSDNAIIFLYQANEGFPFIWQVDDIKVNIFEEIHKELERLEINPKNLIFIHANFIMKKCYRKWKRDSKYANYENFNLVEFNSHRYLDWDNTGPERGHLNYTFSKFDIKKDRKKYFLSFNREPRNHRVMLLSRLFQDGLLNKGYISCPKLDYPMVKDKWWLGSGNSTSEQKKIYVSPIKNLIPQAPLIIDGADLNINQFNTSPEWPYEESYFSIVTETHFWEETVFMSEKIWKPMANYHPFILVGNCGTLKELRKQGFKTFHPFIDESYDEIENPYMRLEAIVKELNRLCNYKVDEIKSWYADLESILKHNKSVLLNDTTTLMDFVDTMRSIVKK